MPVSIICPICQPIVEKIETESDDENVTEEEVVRFTWFDNWEQYAKHILASHPKDLRATWAKNALAVGQLKVEVNKVIPVSKPPKKNIMEVLINRFMPQKTKSKPVDSIIQQVIDNQNIIEPVKVEEVEKPKVTRKPRTKKPKIEEPKQEELISEDDIQEEVKNIDNYVEDNEDDEPENPESLVV